MGVTNLNNAVAEDCRVQNDPSIFERLKGVGKTQRVDPRIDLSITLKIQAQT